MQFRRRDAEGDFFRQLVAPVPLPFPQDLSRQGIYLCTAQGRLLAYLRNVYQDMDLLGLLRQGLLAFEGIPLRERAPGTLAVPELVADPAAEPKPPQDGLVLRVYARRLQSGPRGLERSSEPVRAHDMTFLPSPQQGHMWLSKSDCEALVPLKLQVGAPVTLPAELVTQLCTLHLADTTCGAGKDWGREEAESMLISGRVRSVGKQLSTLDLEGKASFAHRTPMGSTRLEVKLQGRLRCETASRRIVSWDMVGLGTATQVEGGQQHVQLLGFGFERADGSLTEDVLLPHEDHFNLAGHAPRN